MNFKWFWRALMPVAVLTWSVLLKHDTDQGDIAWMVIDSIGVLACVFLTWLAWTKPEKMTDAE